MIKKYGAIDIGTNAIRLLIMQTDIDKEPVKLKKVSLVRVPIRLGEDVFLHGSIGEEKRNGLLAAIKGYGYIMEAMQVDWYRAVATSAFREASNGLNVLEEIMIDSGVKIDLITGEEEASILYSTQLSEVLDVSGNYLFIDVGGGSTELSLFINKQLIASTSFKIGTVRLLLNKVDQKEFNRMKTWLKDQIQENCIITLLGSGGNINKLIKLIHDNKKCSFASRFQLSEIYGQLKNLNFEERIEKFQLKEDRADVIIPAAEIFLNIFEWTEAKEIYVPKVGLADGLILNHLKASKVI